MFPQHSSGMMQLQTAPSERSEGSARWEKLPLPFLKVFCLFVCFILVFLIAYYWYQVDCSGDSGYMPAPSLGANNYCKTKLAPSRVFTWRWDEVRFYTHAQASAGLGSKLCEDPSCKQPARKDSMWKCSERRTRCRP